MAMRSTHTYKTEGKYPITINIDGNCIQHDMVTIKKFISDTTIGNNEALKTLFGNPIDGNYSPTVGQSVLYSSTVHARSFEWSVSNYSNYPIKRTKEAQYVFLTPGLKVLQLVLDGDPSKTYKKDIIVQPLSFCFQWFRPGSSSATDSSLYSCPGKRKRKVSNSSQKNLQINR